MFSIVQTDRRAFYLLLITHDRVPIKVHFHIIPVYMAIFQYIAIFTLYFKIKAIIVAYHAIKRLNRCYPVVVPDNLFIWHQ